MRFGFCLLIFVFISQNSFSVITVSRQTDLDHILDDGDSQQSDQVDATDNSYVISSDYMPLNKNYYPTLSNGYIGHVVFSDTLFMNGLFNGKKGQSHKAKIPVRNPRMLLYNTRNQYTLDMAKHTFTHLSSTVGSAKNGTQFTVTSYAHSVYTRLLVFQISYASEAHGFASHTLHIDTHINEQAYDDITILNSTTFQYNSSFCTNVLCPYLLTATITSGRTKIAEEDFSEPQDVVVMASKIPFTIIFTSPTSYLFFISVAPTLEKAKSFYEAGMKSVSAGTFFTSHVDNWYKTITNTSIYVKGSSTLDQAIKSSMYYLRSSFPPPEAQNNYSFDFYGVGPGGAAHGSAGKDYQGHVFWDQDFWMVPGLLPLFPDLAQRVIEYRIKNLPGAIIKAKGLNWTGAAYPWETAYTGADVCPGQEYITGEIHVTADVIHLLKQYVKLTNNWTIFSEELASFSCGKKQSVSNSYSCKSLQVSNYSQCVKVTGWDMVRETAMFWQYKAEWNDDQRKFVINDVMGPDEYHYPVNNSVFTNVIASQSLKFAVDVADRLGICSDLAVGWRNVSDHLVVLFDSVSQFHPEYEGFNSTTDVVKQADAIMLGFPLNFNMSSQIRRNDLSIYEKSTTSHGPAMTWGMFAINWLDLGDEARAGPMFLRQLKNIQSPFKIWSENSNGGGAVNFLTGMGGFIQSIVYGYFGLRVNEQNITFTPYLLPINNTSVVDEMTLKGVHYHQLVFDITVNKTNIHITYASNYHSFVIKGSCLTIRVVASSKKFLLCNPTESAVTERTKIEVTISS